MFATSFGRLELFLGQHLSRFKPPFLNNNFLCTTSVPSLAPGHLRMDSDSLFMNFGQGLESLLPRGDAHMSVSGDYICFFNAGHMM